LLAYFELMNHLLLLFLVVIYLIPILGQALSYRAFFLILLLSILLNIIHLLRTHGRPSLTAEYGQRVLTDDRSQFVFYACIFFLAVPTFAGLIPIICRSALFVAQSLQVVLPSKIPPLYRLLRPRLQQLTSKSREIWQYCALVEVGVGIMFVIQLFFAVRNILLTVMYWQYLRQRYALSNDCRMAFGRIRMTLDQKLLGIPVLGNVYSKLCSLLSSMGDPNQQRSACVIS